MQETLARIKTVNPMVNALVDLLNEEDCVNLTSENYALERSLGGMPMAIKDLANVKGFKTTEGSPLYSGRVAQKDDQQDDHQYGRFHQRLLDRADRPTDQIRPIIEGDDPRALGQAALDFSQALFDTGEVTGVFFGSDFVSVTKGEGAQWTELKPQIVAVLLDHFVSEAPLFHGGSAAGIAVPAEDTLTVEEDPADADIVDQIKELLETRIRPAVAGDGGDIAYRGYRDGVVHLQLQGACDGCPSSTATLKHGIEGLLKHYVPEVVEVRAA